MIDIGGNKIASGLDMKGLIPYLREYEDVFVVSDINVLEFARLIVPLDRIIVLTATEANKTLSSVQRICNFLLECNASRKALLLGIGGGITTDIANFAASIYKRGIRCALVPTTLLAQVDASIGGKNGVNLAGYKNMIGTIRLPEFVYICPQFLKTLRYEEFLCGLAELLKTFIISSKENYKKAVSLFSDIHSFYVHAAADPQAGVTLATATAAKAVVLHQKALCRLIEAAAKAKAGIVSQDLYEDGERRKLNLGHTLAHAIEHEALRGGMQPVPHGKAVAIGIIYAARLAEVLGYRTMTKYKDKDSGVETYFSLSEILVRDFSACGLPVESPFPLPTLLDAMKMDKKAENGIIHFALPVEIGKVIIKDLEYNDLRVNTI